MENNEGGDDQQSGPRKNSSASIAAENNNPARSASAPNNNQAESHKREPRPLIIWTAILAIGTVALGCAAIWSDFLIRDQLIEMRKASIDTKNAVEATNRLADAARDQANAALDTEHRQLRAYVGPVINSLRLTTRPIDCDPSVSLVRIWPHPRVCYHTKNYGLTRAIGPRECGDILNNANVIFANNPTLADTINNVIMRCRQNYGTPLSTNWPQEQRQAMAATDQRIIAEMLASPSHTGTLFFMIKYQDIFGDHHTTYVCRTVVYPPNPGQFTTRCPIEVPQDD